MIDQMIQRTRGVWRRATEKYRNKNRALVAERGRITARQRRAVGTLEATFKVRSAESYWALVAKSAPDECWLWIGPVRGGGYGEYALVGGKRMKAHRAAYHLAKGPIPDGLIVRHTCDNRRCCNPAHLLAGTYKENAQDRDSRGRNGRPRAKLTIQQTRQVFLDTRRAPEIARQYGITKEAVYAIWKRKNCAVHTADLERPV